MDDNLHPQDQTSSDPPIDEEHGSETANVRIFDITPDLNISPVKEDADSQPNSPESPAISEPAVINKITPAQPQVPPQREFGPANPPTKTISNPNRDIATTRTPSTETAASLHEEISGIIESDKIAQDHTEVNDPNVKRLRTYESDIADLMSQKKLSRASIAIAEDKKKAEATKAPDRAVETSKSELPIKTEIPKKIENRPVEQKKDWILDKKIRIEDVEVNNKPISNRNPSHLVRNIFLTIVSLVLISGGLYAAYYLYSLSPVSPIKTTPTPVSSSPNLPAAMITADIQRTLYIDGMNKVSIAEAIRGEIAKIQGKNTVTEIVPILSSDQLAGPDHKTITKIPAKIMLNLMGIGLPDILSRSITSDWMLGVYSDTTGQKNVFVVVANDFFQNTFAGMLQWESSMPESVRPFIGNASTTINSAHFVDRIVKNRDVREYVTSDKKTQFLYSFVSNDKLVIAENEEALTEAITRLERQNSIR